MVKKLKRTASVLLFFCLAVNAEGSGKSDLYVVHGADDKMPIANYDAGLQKRCGSGEKDDCYRLGLYYAYGINGKKKNSNTAIQYLRTACRMGKQEACYEVGYLYERGADQTEKNIQAAVMFYQKACAGKVSDACMNLAMLYEEKKDSKKALSYFVKSCHLENEEGCYESAKTMKSMRGYTKEDAKKFYRKACKMGFLKACKE